MLRRNFIKASCLPFLNGTKQSSPLAQTSPQNYDLIVVGCGAAGLSAAISAHDAGLKKIVILEKLPVIGGTSANSGGAIAVSGTKYQRIRGIQDSDQRFFDDLMREGGYVNNPFLVKALIKATREQYEWLLSIGFTPINLMAASGMSVPRSHMFNANLLIPTLYREAINRGIEIRTGRRALKLLESDGKISGVICVKAKKISEWNSSHGVVLATGGFARNQAIMNKFAPQMYGVEVISGIGSEGDGLLMALQKNGRFYPKETVTASFGFTKNPSTVKNFSTIYYSGAIILNRNAQRFVNESISYKLIGEAFLATGDSSAFILFDEAIRKQQMSKRPVDKDIWSPFDKGLEPNYCFRGKTINEVADKAGLNPQKVEETVKRYNSFVEAGIDLDFGRQSLSSGYGKPVKIQKQPFYIMPAIAVVPGTYCGLSVDEKARVLDQAECPIEGLFAAGEIMGGVHGNNFVTGTGLGKALAFGKIAGQSASYV